MIRAVIGLGNPGKKYQHNRHNFGHMGLDYIAERFNLTFKPGRDKSAFSFATTSIPDRTVYLCKNTTFMNNSGLAVRQILNQFNLQTDEILIVYDDIDLPLGKIRLREKGSAGGHRGMRSIIETLATNQFARLRLGIGPQDEGVPSEDFVLTDFRPAEKELVEAVLAESYECILIVLESGIRPAMEHFNRRDLRAARPQEVIQTNAINKPIILT
ncbi:MAG TPA: aminoacyl-tRNA hydrolase [Candidatus Marinimicrobia bacterium]|nr:aminoacyl-tRNA hydrolase [Candidatus Neomarinimicrobiota bacterium]HRS52255.1 aminoacyl-tRNA hydrolase [Candidatus Neomarinimicrobiota bacterium]HRU91942.1 aminoacyl-tRNA hydrolase [Candidatus Neomarinimicrobiota bacterium]